MIKKKALILFLASLLPAMLSSQTSYDLLLMAKALNASGKSREAVELLSSVAGISDSRILTARADSRILTGDIAGAIGDYNSANKLKQYSGEYGLARAYALKGDVSTSIYHLEATMRSPVRKSVKEIMLDPAFTKIENTPEWRLFWKKEWYSAPEVKVSEIEYYLKASKTGEARALLSELERDYPGDKAIYAGALVNLAQGRNGDAIKSLADLLAGEPGNEKYLRALASAQAGMSNSAGASATYSRLIGMEIEDPELYLMRAVCYRKTGEREKAMADISKYLEFYPGNKAALSLAGETESALGNNLKALEYFSKNLRLHPNDPQCYIERGNSYFLSRSWQWAVNDFSMSLDLDPDNSEAWLNKGIALANMGRTEDACHDFRKSFSLGNKRAGEYISRYCIR